MYEKLIGKLEEAEKGPFYTKEEFEKIFEEYKRKHRIRIYIDMDDTLCQFTKSKNEHLERNPDNKYPWCQLDFFRNLEEVQSGVETIKLLAKEGYDVWILTRPSIRNPLSYMEKRIWVEEHLGFDWCDKLILCPNKSLLIGDILIDDKIWENFKGIQLHFGSESCSDWETAYKQIHEYEKI